MRTKRKSVSHIIENKSLSIIADLLPKYWTIREYKPDYGLDLTIELFEKKLEKKQVFYDTLGEHIFIQVKGVENVKKSKIKVWERNNIENNPLEETDKYYEIDVIKYSIDTIELQTIQRMGCAVPVLLFLVDTSKEKIYFLCLNDYIDKIIIPSEPNYYIKKSKILNIPLVNEITNDSSSLFPIYLYAKRPKYYAFFNKVGYQLNELNFCGESELTKRTMHFAQILLQYDIWNNEFNWHALEYFYKNLKNLISNGSPQLELKEGVDLDDKEKIWESGSCDMDELYTEKDMFRLMRIRSFWQQMDNLKNVFESMSREWFLPTYLAVLMK